MSAGEKVEGREASEGGTRGSSFLAASLLHLIAPWSTAFLSPVCFSLFPAKRRCSVEHSSVDKSVIMSTMFLGRNALGRKVERRDLSAGLVNVLTDIIWKSTIDWHAGNVGCKTIRYAQGVVTCASTYALVALSLDRLHAIARPLSFSSSITVRRCVVLWPHP
ncbi:hypothetical protein ACOMHN_054481 [Nucella lapillus]